MAAHGQPARMIYLAENPEVLYKAQRAVGTAATIGYRVGTQSTFNEDLSAAKTTADAALSEMVKYGVPPTPPNFCVWYNYVSKSIAGLTRDIDERLALQKGFGWQANQELFERYFGTDAEAAAVRRSGSELKQTVGRVLLRLDAAGADAAAFGETLVQVHGSLKTVPTVEGSRVQAVVHRLSGATSDMVKRNRDLEGELRKSTDEIQTLQERLDQARREAFTDALTGIGNRRCFDLALLEHAERAAHGDLELCLLLVDIDHFKKFNDSYGHRIGDQVLKVVGGKMKEMSRGTDVAARYGGEEFALLLVGAPFDIAMGRADQLREALASQYLRNKATGDLYGQVTVSIGVAKYRMIDNVESFISRADAALYEAKNAGRNRVIAEAA
jgi:diguanylate cyclase